jgi:putative ABC transport system permease protein
MLLARMALRNLTRQFARNVLSMVSIVIGVLIIVVGRSFVGGLTENVVRGQIDTVSSHVLARPADYPSTGVRHPVDHLLTLDAPTREWLDQHSEAWTGRVLAAPRAIHKRDALRVRLVGYDPAGDDAVFSHASWVIEGKAPEAADAVLVSTGIARLLDLTVGEPFALELRTASGALNAMRVVASGIVTTGSPAYDRVAIFAPIPLVADLAQTGEGISHLSLRLADVDDSDTIAAELGQRLGSAAQVVTWETEAAPVVSANQLRQKMLNLVALALFGMAATGIANTVLMAAYERTREIGTLRALGLDQRGVVGMFALEGLGMGVVGSTVGGLAGLLITRHYSGIGIDLSSMLTGRKGMENMPLSTTLYLQFSPPTIAAAVLAGIVVALLASLYPAIMASRLEPAEAVRAE